MIDVNVFVLGKPITANDLKELSEVVTASRRDAVTNRKMMKCISMYVVNDEVHFDTRKDLKQFLKDAREIVGVRS